MNAEATMERELNNVLSADLDKIRAGIDEALGAEPKNSMPRFAEKLADATAGEIDRIDHSELERFLAQGERLLEQQRKRILAAESRYEAERLKLVDYFRIRLRNLEHEAAEAIRALDRRHAAKAADAQKILSALTAMRDG